jgi:hypothetical protein
VQGCALVLLHSNHIVRAETERQRATGDRGAGKSRLGGPTAWTSRDRDTWAGKGALDTAFITKLTHTSIRSRYVRSPSRSLHCSPASTSYLSR